MYQPTVSIVLIMVWLFVYCFYGSLINWKLGQVGEFAYNSQFYKYPEELRLFTLFMIARSQRPFYITGYYITKCSLESYARVSIFMFFSFSFEINSSGLMFCIRLIHHSNHIYSRKIDLKMCIFAVYFTGMSSHFFNFISRQSECRRHKCHKLQCQLFELTFHP